MSSHSGPRLPRTGEQIDIALQGDWADCPNITAADDVGASCALASGQASNYLVARDFGFQIPDGAEILGVVAEIRRRNANATEENVAYDATVSLSIALAPDHASEDYWPAAYAWKSYGGESDLWGLTLTPADVNESQFKIVLRVHRAGASGENTVEVDAVRVTVYYRGGSSRKIAATGWSQAYEDTPWK